MSAIDLSRLLDEVSPESPCGKNLEYDSAFRELELAAAGKPERRTGDSVVAAEPPDWRDVRERSLELLRRTKDLRAAVHLARSLLETDGMVGFRDGLAFFRQNLERYWDSIHPQLDSEDGHDPTLRVNTISALGDWNEMVRSVREQPLVVSRRLGRFSLRDIEIADGTLPKPAAEGVEFAESSTIEAAFTDADGAELQATFDGLRGAIEEVGRITAFVTVKVGATRSADLSRLTSTLMSAERALAPHLSQNGDSDGAANLAGGSDTRDQRRAGAGEITSRDEVIRFLDKACDYFRKNEPSSPVPLLLQRAKRLVSKDFLEIVKDLAPGGVSEVRGIGGLDSEE